MDPASFLWHLWYWICSFQWFWLLLVRSRSITRFVHRSSPAFSIFCSVLTQVFNHGWKPCKFSPTLKKATFSQTVYFRFSRFTLSIPVQISPCSDMICSLLFTYYIHQKTLRHVLGYTEISAKTAAEVHEALQLLLKLSLWVPDPFKPLIVWCEIHLSTPVLPRIPQCFKQSQVRWKQRIWLTEDRIYI